MAANMNSSNQTVPAAAEFAVVTTQEVSFPRANCSVWLWGFVAMNSGAAATAVKMLIRRGTDATGTIVSVSQNENIKTAGNTRKQVMSCVDTPPTLGTSQYTLTVLQVGTGKTSNCLQAVLIAMYFE